MTSRRVVVLDYGSGNLRSAQRALERAGVDVVVTADRETAIESDGLVVPGVGAFAACMRGLDSVGGSSIIDRRLAGGRPVLGICVGMQILFTEGVEHGERTRGLDQLPGTVEQLDSPVLPHMGWDTVEAPRSSQIFAGVESEYFYFVHSFGVRRSEFSDPGNSPLDVPEVTWCGYGGGFIAAVENGPLVATQFHPEKSGDAGQHLLRNWVRTLG